MLLSGDVLDRCGDLRGIIKMGEPVLPWAMLFHMPLDILPQIAETFPLMSPWTFVVDIAQDPLDGVGPRTVRREPEQRKTWRTGDPLVDGFRFMNAGVLHDNIDTRHLSSRVRAVQQRQEFPKQAILFTRAETIEYFASRQMQRASQGVLFIGARGHELCLRALEHPGCTALGQEMTIEFIRKHQDCMRLHVVRHKPNTGAPLDPVWLSIFGHELGAFPDPADLMEPAAHGFCGHRDAMLGLERHGERGTAPPGAAPALGPWGFFEQRAERAREPGHQESGLDRDGELTVVINTDTQAPGTIRPHDAVHTGA